MEINQKLLYQKYIIEQKSLDEISQEIGISRYQVRIRLDKFNIPIRTNAESKLIRHNKNRNYDLEKKICEDYKNGLSSVKIAKKYDIKYSGYVIKILKRNGVEIRDTSHNHRKYTIDEFFFDEIDCQEKAYFLGFLYADGGNVGYSVLLSLKASDEEILLKMAKLLQTDKPLTTIKKRIGEVNDYVYKRLDISNQRLVQQLNNKGVVQNKTFKIRFPEWLPNEFVRHFIRGFFDGDGGLDINKKTNKANFTLTSNEFFLLAIQDIFKILNIGSTLRKVKNKNAYKLATCGNKQILRLLQWLYDESSIHLERKYQKYQHLINNPHGNDRVKH